MSVNRAHGLLVIFRQRWRPFVEPTWKGLKFAAITLIPILAAHSCFAPFWIAKDYFGVGVWWFAHLFVTAFVGPAWLAFLGCRLVLQRPIAVPVGLCLLAVTFALNVFLPYAFWGITSGRFWTPDQQTLDILGTAGLFGLAIAAG